MFVVHSIPSINQGRVVVCALWLGCLLLELLGGWPAVRYLAPGLVRTDEVDCGNLGAKPLICRCICVCGCWGRVIDKAKPVPIGPAPFIEQTLVSTVPTSLGFSKLLQFLELVLSRGEDHHPGVEYIWPSYIRYSGEFVRESEQMGERADGENVGV